MPTPDTTHHALQLASEHLQRLGCRVLQRLPSGGRDRAALAARDGEVLVLVAVTWRQAPADDRHPREVPVFPRAWVQAHRRLCGVATVRFDAIDVLFDDRLRLVSLAHVREIAQPPARTSRAV
jgi:hypothetical protein